MSEQMNLATIASLPAAVSIPFADLVDILKREMRRLQGEIASAYGSARIAKAIVLKIANVALLRNEFARRHTNLLAKPFGYLIDPSNSCQLKCPGCIHGFPQLPSTWDKHVLDDFNFDAFLKKFGPPAVDMNFYNWGEPLINRRLPEMIAKARTYLTGSCVSTNLSLQFDAEALVSSRLSWMIISVDGVSQAVLEKYRRGARAELVFENIRKLVDAKKRFNSYTPVLDWQYLMFGHNVCEVARAEEFARELGINQIRFGHSYHVSDPELNTTDVPEARTVTFEHTPQEVKNSFRSVIGTLSPDIDEAFEAFLDCEIPASYNGGELRQNECRWLFENSSMDANGRMLPCCGVPSDETWFFGQVQQPEVFNSEMYISARTLDPGKPTACHECPANNGSFAPNIPAERLGSFLWYVDPLNELPIQQLAPLWS